MEGDGEARAHFRLKANSQGSTRDHGLIWTNSAGEVSVRQTNCFQISTGQGWREQTVIIYQSEFTQGGVEVRG